MLRLAAGNVTSPVVPRDAPLPAGDVPDSNTGELFTQISAQRKYTPPPELLTLDVSPSCTWEQLHLLVAKKLSVSVDRVLLDVLKKAANPLQRVPSVHTPLQVNSPGDYR